MVTNVRRLVSVVIALALALICLYYWLKPAFPGSLLLPGWGEIYLIDADGRHFLGEQLMYPGTGDHYAVQMHGLSISPDGKREAHIETRDGEHIRFVVVRMLKYKPLEPVHRYRRHFHWIPFDKQGASVSGMSRLEWSPDGSKLAYASSSRLYVVDTRTERVVSARLPANHDLEAIGKSLRTRRAESLAEIERFRALEYRVGLKAANKIARGWKRSAFPPAGMRPMCQRAFERVRTTLHVTPRGSMASLADHITITYGFGSGFRYSGHTLRWIKADTIMCDNWKLRIVRLDSHKLELAATKTPLLSEWFLRPVWSPSGDRAAYLVPKRDNQRPRRVGLNELVIVDSRGTILRRGEVMSSSDLPRWSQDGNYLATRNLEAGPHGFEDAFYVYNVESLDSRRVTLPPGPYYLGDPYPGWDWRM